ncbi:MAG: ribulose-phosphate 3-epimerase [Lachnospiraceae bacterium]|nr:ribulose-phosphate 3-epimerase [Lachnospiraceae bacterium]
MNCLSPSILAADFARLGEQIEILDRAGAQYLHIDVMDGVFVPDISFGMPVVKSIRSCTERIFDVHLMVTDPDHYIDAFYECGADLITVHAEAVKHLDATIEKIHAKGIIAGVALSPATPIERIEWVLPKTDMVLVMTVNPGYGGQKLIPYTLDKVRMLREVIRKKGLKTDIEVDGGITLENVREVIAAGANIIVSGSSVFEGDIQENAEEFLRILSEEQRG